MASEQLFGWDLTFKTVEKDIKRKADIVIAFVHWILIRRGFRNIGIGDERTLSKDEEKSELLPTGWNDKENYALRYVLDNKLFILHGISSDANLLINLMRSDDLAVSNYALKVEDTVKELSGSVNIMIPTHKDLIYNVTRDLVEPVTEGNSNTASTQTSRPSSNTQRLDDPLRVGPRPVPGSNPDNPDLWYLN